ncbi:MAG: hypothetical protein GEU93_01640 [Propionibacteriales bacterium]|nr:hypothetical protein [Propionibacteriales bacterium]
MTERQTEEFEGDVGPEAPEADIFEQRTEAGPHDEAPPRRDVPLEVDAADAAEQDREVDLDEDEYR